MFPTYSSPMYLYPSLAMVGLIFLRDYTSDKPDKKKLALYILGALFLINIALTYPSWYDTEANNFGRIEFPKIYLSLQSYLLSNTSANDVFMSNNELSFMINSISGRDLVVSRRSQNDPFVDFDKKQQDASIILYGNNLEKRIELIKKYEIDYFYCEYGWPHYEFKFKEVDGQTVPYDYYDPYMMIYSKSYEDALKTNGIYYRRIFGYIDPAIRSNDIRDFELLLITMDNYDPNGKCYWQSDIDPYLEKVWEYNEDDQPVAALYKVNIQSSHFIYN
jgi:hypothetical protein